MGLAVDSESLGRSKGDSLMELTPRKDHTIPDAYWRHYRLLEFVCDWGWLIVFPLVASLFFILMDVLPGMDGLALFLFAVVLPVMILLNICGIWYFRYPCPRCGNAFSGVIAGYVCRREIMRPSKDKRRVCGFCGLRRGAHSTNEELVGQEENNEKRLSGPFHK